MRQWNSVLWLQRRHVAVQSEEQKHFVSGTTRKPRLLGTVQYADLSSVYIQGSDAVELLLYAVEGNCVGRLDHAELWCVHVHGPFYVYGPTNAILPLEKNYDDEGLGTGLHHSTEGTRQIYPTNLPRNCIAGQVQSGPVQFNSDCFQSARIGSGSTRVGNDGDARISSGRLD